MIKSLFLINRAAPATTVTTPAQTEGQGHSIFVFYLNKLILVNL